MSKLNTSGGVRSREVIGVEQFTQRREVFDKFDTVFLPSAAVPASPQPASPLPGYQQFEPIITSNHGKTTANFIRNSTGYSSMRETRTEERNIEFRSRKYSDNLTSELNQSDDVDYRKTMTERTRRLSKLRRDFLNSNLHEPNSDKPFAKTGLRASMPAKTTTIANYKLESPKIHKFSFAEYCTPTPERKRFVALELSDGEKENEEPKIKPRHVSLPNDNDGSPKNQQKLFEELVKRYSPQRKPVNWNLPPTRPRIVGSVPKSTSSVGGTIDREHNKKKSEDGLYKTDDGDDNDDVFVKEVNKAEKVSNRPPANETNKSNNTGTSHTPDLSVTVITNSSTDVEPSKLNEQSKDRNFKSVLTTERAETNDEIINKTKMETIQNSNSNKYTDLSIPALIEKITEDVEDLEKKKKPKKVERKRSLIDKLLFRKKNISKRNSDK